MLTYRERIIYGIVILTLIAGVVTVMLLVARDWYYAAMVGAAYAVFVGVTAAAYLLVMWVSRSAGPRRG